MEPSRPDASTVGFTASDGAELLGDLVLPRRPRGAAAICHPHPQYGGNRFDSVVTALFEVLPSASIAALRFDFRQRFGGGVAEVGDLEGALALLAERLPGLPVVAVGYSFGAAVVARLERPAVVAKVLVAPPIGAIDLELAGSGPTLVMCPAHDQFAPPEVAGPVVAGWPSAELQVIEMADHFLHGRTADVAERTLAWLDPLLP